MGKKSSSNGLNFKKGDKIFAKIKGFPYWPARIESIPNDGVKKFKIMFYGTYQTNMIKPDCILPFNEETKHSHGQKKQKSFLDAMWEIENDPNLKNLNKSKKQNKSDEISEENVDVVNEEMVAENSPSSPLVSKNNIEDAQKELDEDLQTSNDKTDEASTINENIDKNVLETSKRSQRYSNRKEKLEDRQFLKSSKYKKFPLKSKSFNEKDQKENEEKDLILDNNDSSKEKLKQESAEDIENEEEEEAEKETTTNNRNKRHRNKKSNKRQNEQNEYERLNKKSRRSLKSIQDNENEDKSDKLEDSVVINDLKETQSKEESTRTSSSARSRSSSSSSDYSKEYIKNENKSKQVNKYDDAALVNYKIEKKVKTDQLKTSSKKDFKKAKENSFDAEISSSTDKKNKKIFQQLHSKLVYEKTKELTEEELVENKKLIDKKLKFINSIRIQLALLRMDFEIKKSLRVDNTDVNNCCLIMQDLIKLPFKKSHLFITPVIVDTIKKCRKFKNSEKVREASTECYNKFCKVLNLNADETFSSEFDKERCKYLNENMTLIKKQRKIAYKLIASDRRKANANADTPSKLSNINPTIDNISTKKINSDEIKSELANPNDQNVKDQS